MATDQRQPLLEIDGRAAQALRGGELHAAITRAVVAVHRRHLGRGPTKAQAFYGQNIVVAVLSEVMTAQEHTLASAGRGDIVQSVRAELQRTMHDELVAAVEHASGCRVLARMSDIHVESDTASDVFVLDRPIQPELAGLDGAARSANAA